ncbi:uncharacterized protein LOC124151000 isoform X2 [Haliotis rufescens]|uniref:uncharacterized protein LOC124151000 isoform X2 n=1 Tax=Haliotis rufescens TaxID=6454 RepID=UPI00201F7424|nr:uncharacterized protein LOC124151000 isoform X2 [Haliotis rufescens]
MKNMKLCTVYFITTGNCTERFVKKTNGACLTLVMSMTKIFRMFLSLVSVMLLVAILFVFSTKDEIPHDGERGPTSAGASNLHGTIPRKLCVDGVIPLKTFTRYDPDADIDLAVVSAYFDIGRFKKGLSKGLYFNASTYTAWAGAFSHLYNPLVFYTDSEFFENIVKKLRIHLPRNLTRIIRINQTSMWSFKLRDRISAIYQNPDYPKFYPNTVVPNYSCAMHAKYEVVENAILNKYVTSDYVTWLDVGYFRYLKRNKPFKLVVPKSFSANTVAFNKLHHPDRFSEPEVIFKNNSLYVGGGMFIGRLQIMLLFILDYRHASEVLLHRGLSNTDQQVLYAMYNSNFRSRVNPGVDIQLFKSNIVGDCWFYLGYQCYRELQ